MLLKSNLFINALSKILKNLISTSYGYSFLLHIHCTQHQFCAVAICINISNTRVHPLVKMKKYPITKTCLCGIL